MTVFAHSILSKATITRRLLLPTASSSSTFFTSSSSIASADIIAAVNFFSTSPDYTNYETWHRTNYEDAEHQHNALSTHHPPCHPPHKNNIHLIRPGGGGLDDANNNIHSINGWPTLEHHHHRTADNENTEHHPWLPLGTELPRTSVLMELTDRVGALHDVLRFL